MFFLRLCPMKFRIEEGKIAAMEAKKMNSSKVVSPPEMRNPMMSKAVATEIETAQMSPLSLRVMFNTASPLWRDCVKNYQKHD